jgi:hypothetical protein
MNRRLPTGEPRTAYEVVGEMLMALELSRTGVGGRVHESRSGVAGKMLIAGRTRDPVAGVVSLLYREPEGSSTGCPSACMRAPEEKRACMNALG